GSGRAGASNTSAPRSLVPYLAMLSTPPSTTITGAVIVPFVLPVHALAWPGIGWLYGVRMRPSYDTFSQPRPKRPHGSTSTPVRPHDFSVVAVHSFAAFIPGEPVSRGPMTSVR